MDFTRKELDVINRAFAQIYAMTEFSHRMESDVDEAYKCERKGRSSAAYAKLCIVESFLDGWHDKVQHVRDLYNYSPGCARIIMLAAKLRNDYPNRVTEAQIALLHMAKGTQSAVFDRRMKQMETFYAQQEA